MGAAATADMQAEFTGERFQAALQRPKHTRGDAGRVPVHAHDGAEGLEPEGMGKAAQKFVTAVMMNDCLGDQRAELRHAVSKPGWHASSVKGKVGAACSLRHVVLSFRIGPRMVNQV
jgi:hypothetical protein